MADVSKDIDEKDTWYRDSHLFAHMLKTLLEPDEGMIVHLEGKGYFVFIYLDEDTGTYDVLIDENPEFLEIPNFHRAMLRDSNEPTLN